MHKPNYKLRGAAGPKTVVAKVNKSFQPTGAKPEASATVWTPSKKAGSKQKPGAKT